MLYFLSFWQASLRSTVVSTTLIQGIRSSSISRRPSGTSGTRRAIHGAAGAPTAAALDRAVVRA